MRVLMILKSPEISRKISSTHETAILRLAARKSQPAVVSLAQVRHGAQGVVEAVREICSANYQRQLDDLPLIEEFPQLREGTVADRRSTSRDAFGMQNYGLLFLIEQRAALVE